MKNKKRICEGRIKFDSRGHYKIKPKNLHSCLKLFKKINPSEGLFWRRYIEGMEDKFP